MNDVEKMYFALGFKYGRQFGKHQKLPDVPLTGVTLSTELVDDAQFLAEQEIGTKQFSSVHATMLETACEMCQKCTWSYRLVDAPSTTVLCSKQQLHPVNGCEHFEERKS